MDMMLPITKNGKIIRTRNFLTKNLMEKILKK